MVDNIPFTLEDIKVDTLYTHQILAKSSGKFYSSQTIDKLKSIVLDNDKLLKKYTEILVSKGVVINGRIYGIYKVDEQTQTLAMDIETLQRSESAKKGIEERANTLAPKSRIPIIRAAVLATTGLQFIFKDNMAAMNILKNVSVAAIVLSAGYAVWRAYIIAQTNFQTIAAAADTAIAVASQNWIGIAAAAAASAAVFVAFNVTYSYAQTMNISADVSTPAGRRAAQSTLGGVAYG